MSRPWVLISGASSGFGEATAKLLAAEGWNLLLTSRREERLQSVSHECAALGATVHVAAWDMRDREATDRGVQSLMQAAGISKEEGGTPVSYTHLTLPTICSV